MSDMTRGYMKAVREAVAKQQAEDRKAFNEQLEKQVVEEEDANKETHKSKETGLMSDIRSAGSAAADAISPIVHDLEKPPTRTASQGRAIYRISRTGRDRRYGQEEG